MDEPILEAGVDPIAEHLRLIHHELSRRVVEAVAEMTSWDGATPAPGVGRGMTFTFAFGVPCARIIEVSDTPYGIRLDKLWLASDVGCKPDPAPLLRVISDLETDPANTVYVGDSVTDWQTALAAGVAYAHLAGGYQRTPIPGLAPWLNLADLRDLKSAF